MRSDQNRCFLSLFYGDVINKATQFKSDTSKTIILQTHNIDNILLQEEFEDTKGVLRIR
jgi:hypothetical protein